MQILSSRWLILSIAPLFPVALGILCFFLGVRGNSGMPSPEHIAVPMFRAPLSTVFPDGVLAPTARCRKIQIAALRCDKICGILQLASERAYAAARCHRFKSSVLDILFVPLALYLVSHLSRIVLTLCCRIGVEGNVLSRQLADGLVYYRQAFRREQSHFYFLSFGFIDSRDHARRPRDNPLGTIFLRQAVPSIAGRRTAE